MEAKKRKRAILAAILILVIVVAGISAVQAMKATPPVVTTLAGERHDLARSIVINGAVSADSVFEAILPGAQKVVAVYKKAGDAVKAGDLLVDLDTTELKYQLDKALLGLEQLKASTANARAQAAISLNTARLALAQAKKNNNDALEKYKDDRITALVRDQSSTALKTAEDQVKLAQSIYDSLDLDSASSDRKKQVDAINLDIENLRRKIADSSVKSPIAGTVSVLEARLEQFPGQQTNLVQVVDLARLTIKARVDQYDTVQLKPGQPAAISVKGLVGEFAGTISTIDNVATTQGGANSTPKYSVAVAIDPAVLAAAQTLRLATGGPGGQPSGSATGASAGVSADPGVAVAAAIKPGYEVDARVVVEQRPNVLVVPPTALQSVKHETAVFIVRDGQAVRQVVKTGLETVAWVEILEGLKPEDRVIITPPENLKAGDRVTLG